MADYAFEGAKWGNGLVGAAGGLVTWAIDDTISASFLPDIAAAFDRWSSYANITFRQAASSASAMIDLSFGVIDGHDNVLGITNYSYSGSSLISAAVEFDSGELWTVSNGHGFSYDGVRFYAVALHEIGHALGLDHYNATPAIMNSFISSDLTDLAQPDTDGIQALYGRAFTPTATSALQSNWTGNSDLGIHPGSGWQVKAIGDFNADHSADVFWFNQATGETDTWLLKNGHWAASVSFGTHPGASTIAGVADFNGDGTSDVLWFDQNTGKVDEWKISNGKWAGSVDIGAHPGSGWIVGGTGDYNGDHTSDVLWVNAASGATDIWEFRNGNWMASVSPGSHSPSSTVVGTGDFYGGGTSDILWFNPSTGDLDLWKIENGHWAGSVDLGAHPGTGWHVAGTGDYNGNDTTDILWSNSNTGENDLWLIANGHWAGSVNLGTHAATDWLIPHQA